AHGIANLVLLIPLPLALYLRVLIIPAMLERPGLIIADSPFGGHQLDALGLAPRGAARLAIDGRRAGEAVPGLVLLPLDVAEKIEGLLVAAMGARNIWASLVRLPIALVDARRLLPSGRACADGESRGVEGG